MLMAYEDGTKLTVDGGTYYMASAHDSLIYAGGKNSEIAYVNGGSFTLGNVGAGENGKPWIFNVLGAGDHRQPVRQRAGRCGGEGLHPRPVPAGLNNCSYPPWRKAPRGFVHFGKSLRGVYESS